MTYCIAQGTRFNILQQLKMGKSLKIYMCVCVCVCMYTYRERAESLCCTLETNITLSISYSPMKTKYIIINKNQGKFLRKTFVSQKIIF